MASEEITELPIATMIELALQGDADAEALLLTDVMTFLAPIAAARHRSHAVGGRVSASDLVQASSLRVMDTLADFRGDNRQQWRSWLKAILINELRIQHRYHHAAKRSVKSQQPIGEAAEPQKKSSIGNLSRMVRDEQLFHLATALQQLSDDDKLVIHQRFFDNLSLADIADRLGLSVDATAKRLYRAVDRLRSKL